MKYALYSSVLTILEVSFDAMSKIISELYELFSSNVISDCCLIYFEESFLRNDISIVSREVIFKEDNALIDATLTDSDLSYKKFKSVLTKQLTN